MHVPTTTTLPDFIKRWQSATLTERSASQSHFIQLCQVLGQPSPTEVDQAGTDYTFEKGVSKSTGGHGFADVWKRGYFAWEYKGRHKDLNAAYAQLQLYREDLDNPPLMVVCDLNRFEVHTNYTGTTKRVYKFELADLASTTPLPGTTLSALDVLRAVFTNPDRLRPEQTAANVTEEAARQFARLAESLRTRGADPEEAARYLMRLLFCLFAEDIGLLPAGLFTNLVARTRSRPEEFTRRVRQLFEAMAKGGSFGVEDILHFNGGLFDDDTALDLTETDLNILHQAAGLDWASIEPAIFGTLFERSLDPSKRSQLGAHYTSREDILLIVEPVLMEPLRRRWAEVQKQAEEIVARREATTDRAARTRHNDALGKLLMGFRDEISGVRVLDPACGSGNFLYVALKRLLDLEKEVSIYAAQNGLSSMFPTADPSQLYGIEINTYAHELASVVVWIGYIQWLRDNGFGSPSQPILKRLDNIKQMDAILAYDEQGKPVEPEWPEADVIIGNPPFLGGSRVRGELGNEYTDQLFELYEGRISAFADLVCYWFEHAGVLIATKSTKRVGLLATNSIRQGTNRRVLERIKEVGDIFFAWSDRPWILDGAAVRVSMVGFDDGSEQVRFLNGKVVSSINADLSASSDLTRAVRLLENIGIAYIGTKKGGPFDISTEQAQLFLRMPPNVNGSPNSDVIKPWVNGQALLGKPKNTWIIDFGTDTTEAAASLYEAPFEYVKQHVYPERLKNNRESRRRRWWLFSETAPAMRQAIAGLSRCIATPRVSKYRLFVWLSSKTVPDDRIYVLARDDDYFFGVLHSRVHELWSLRTGSWLGVGNDPTYTPSTSFETFPFPWPPGKEPKDEPRVEAIAEAARELVRLRGNWLNPPGAIDADLKKRTLTNLYNQRPTWLDNAHRTLDEAVLDAYGWPHDLSDEEILARLLALNLERSSKQSNVEPAAVDVPDEAE